MHPCHHAGCNQLTTDRYCAAHAQDHRGYDNHRGSAAVRGYDSRWRKYRLAFLRNHPLCVECEKQGRIVPAIVVDHIIPHKGDKHLFWDTNNHQSLCKSHHDSKTAGEDGGFGNGLK